MYVNVQSSINNIVFYSFYINKWIIEHLFNLYYKETCNFLELGRANRTFQQQRGGGGNRTFQQQKGKGEFIFIRFQGGGFNIGMIKKMFEICTNMFFFTLFINCCGSSSSLRGLVNISYLNLTLVKYSIQSTQPQTQNIFKLSILFTRKIIVNLIRKKIFFSPQP